MFRPKDRDVMSKAFDLWSYKDVQTHAGAIAQHLKDGSMPCDGAWPAEHVALFERWVETGTPEWGVQHLGTSAGESAQSSDFFEGYLAALTSNHFDVDLERPIYRYGSCIARE
jgi:hypothetical protein